VAGLFARDALERRCDDGIVGARRQGLRVGGRGAFSDPAVDRALDGDPTEELGSRLFLARLRDLGERRGCDLVAGIRARDREACLRVSDLVDRSLVGATHEIGRSSERDEIERQRRERGDRRVLERGVGQPSLGELGARARAEALERRHGATVRPRLAARDRRAALLAAGTEGSAVRSGAREEEAQHAAEDPGRDAEHGEHEGDDRSDLPAAAAGERHDREHDGDEHRQRAETEKHADRRDHRIGAVEEEARQHDCDRKEDAAGEGEQQRRDAELVAGVSAGHRGGALGMHPPGVLGIASCTHGGGVAVGFDRERRREHLAPPAGIPPRIL